MYNSDPLQNSDKIEISDETRIYIIDKLVEPYYKNIVNNTINGRLCWRKSGIAFETISKIMVAFGSILSFSAGFYHDETLSFISGSISCLSLAFLQLSSFSYKENKKQSEELNILLKKLKLDTIPVFERDTQTQMRQYQSSRPMPMPPNNIHIQKPYNSYNSYNPYNSYNKYDMFDPANSYESYENNFNSYIPPERSIPTITPMHNIPRRRVSSIRSIDIDNDNDNTTTYTIPHEDTIDTTEKKLNLIKEEENVHELKDIIVDNIVDNINIQDENETQVIDKTELNLLQKTVKFFF